MASKVTEMAAAIGWGALAASSLVIGALLSFARQLVAPRQVGLVLAFGAGALISAVSFELAAGGPARSAAPAPPASASASARSPTSASTG